MTSRFAYWTITTPQGPTAFRANERRELVTILKQLQRRHPDAVLKWFAHGRYWASPEEARRPAPAQARPARSPRASGRISAPQTSGRDRSRTRK
jgi:hypothetical protein